MYLVFDNNKVNDILDRIDDNEELTELDYFSVLETENEEKYNDVKHSLVGYDDYLLLLDNM